MRGIIFVFDLFFYRIRTRRSQSSGQGFLKVIFYSIYAACQELQSMVGCPLSVYVYLSKSEQFFEDLYLVLRKTLRTLRNISTKYPIKILCLTAAYGLWNCIALRLLFLVTVVGFRAGPVMCYQTKTAITIMQFPCRII